MPKYYYDLHIHSGLSPCASNDLSPNNIVNMAQLKGLDLIAITDHQSAKNVQVIMEVANETELLVIPGMEVETYEGIHLCCYFKTVEILLQFQEIILQSLPNISNHKSLFGEQVIYDRDDSIIGYEEIMLLNSSEYKLNELIKLVHEYDGLVSLAHVDRMKNSIMTILGFIPPNLNYDLIEVSSNVELESYCQKHRLNKNKVIQNSDAHQLGDLSEAIHPIELDQLTVDALFSYLRGE